MLALSSQHVISGPARTLCNPATKPSRKLSVVLKAAYMPSESVPSPEKRTAMNLLLLGAIGLPVGSFSSSLQPTCMELKLKYGLYMCRLLPWVGPTCLPSFPKAAQEVLEVKLPKMPLEIP